MPNANPAVIQDSNRLAQLYRLALLDSPADEAFDRLTRLASKILNVPVSLVSLVDASRQFFKSQVGLPDPWANLRQTPLSHSFCQHVVASNQPLVIADARQHPLVYDNLAIPDLNVIAYAGIPLVTSEGAALGSFCVIDSKPRTWTDNELSILNDLAMAAMTEMELRSELIGRQRAEAELRAVYEQVRELEQVKTDMIRIAAHDLRNPIGAISGLIELLTAKDGLNNDQRELVNLINQTNLSMQRIVNDILSLERIEHIQHQTACEFNAIVQKAYTDQVFRANHKKLHYQLDLPETIFTVQGDSAQLYEAVGNLISNAIKYTPAEGSVNIGLIQDGKSVHFTVTDSGYGIPQDQQTRLFQPFYRARTAENREIDGTGLGLHLVKNIIDRHGGKMIFHSEYHKGSQFGFQLPIR